MQSGSAPVVDPTRILELPVHMRPTTVAPSPASMFLHAKILPAPAAPTMYSTPATPSSSPTEHSLAFSLLRRVYLQRDLTDAIAELQAGLGALLGGRAVLVLFDASDQPWSPIAEDLQAAVGVAGVEAIRAAAANRRLIMSPDGRGFAAPTVMASKATLVAWRTSSDPQIESHFAPTIGAIASRLSVLDHFVADHEANVRVAAQVQARISGPSTIQMPRSGPTWPLLAFGALLSIALGLVVSAALIQVPSYSRGRVVVRMPSTDVVATNGGRVIETLVVENQRVVAGEPLVRLEATTELDVLARADSAYRAAMAAYLMDPESTAARSALVSATQARDAAKDRLGERTLYAPIDGVVRTMHAGETIASGDHVITIVPDGGEPTMMAFLPSSDAARIKPGMVLEAQITGYDRIRVTITEVEPSASFVRVKARLASPSVDAGGAKQMLHDGQGGLGEIEIDRRSFLSTLFGGGQ